MPLPRLFSPLPVVPNALLCLGDERAHYAGRVLRLRAGDELVVFDGTGGEFGATIERVSRRELQLATGGRRDRDAESPLSIRLVQGLAKGEKMDLIVQKATELGVARISPVLTDFSVVRLDAARAARKREHWQKVAQSACEQCGRNRVPEIDAPVSLVAWFGDHAASGTDCLILRPGAADKLSARAPATGALTLLIGPEGGFSEAEYGRAEAAGLRAVGLGPRILRTETAAVAALSVAQALWGDC